ncbi:hypothetical protein [Hydrogenophaga sp. RWCD_12]|uniref:hypothetical protein n=1 Tax=Hydrogenophaga sp. RWCD_12 TaxID=3391190 RepID=UPI0039848B0C
MKTLRQTFTRWLALAGLLLAMAGCATGQSAKLVNHSFNFDGWKDGWQKTAQLIEYSYGDQDASVRRKAPEGDFLGYQSDVTGPMPVGEFLNVRWRMKATGDVVEQRVDLRGRLPANMANHALTFVIEDRQLYVFVVTPRELPTGAERSPAKTWRGKYNLVYEVYPTLAGYPGGQ